MQAFNHLSMLKSIVIVLLFLFFAIDATLSEGEGCGVQGEDPRAPIVFGSDGTFRLKSGHNSPFKVVLDEEPSEESLIYSLFLNEVAVIASVIEQGYSIEQQYRYLKYLVPVMMNITSENESNLKRASLDDIDAALNGLGECNKEGVRLMILTLKESKIERMFPRELNAFFRNSTRANMHAAQRHPNVTRVFTPASLAAWYSFMPTMIELVVPSLSSGYIVVDRLVQTFESASQVPAPFINFTDILAHAFSIDYTELQPRLHALVSSFPKINSQASRMMKALENRDYELCVIAYEEMHAHLGLSYEGQLDHNSPCGYIRHFKKVA